MWFSRFLHPFEIGAAFWFVVLALTLMHVAKGERRAILGKAMLFALFFAGSCLSIALGAGGADGAAQMLRGVCVVGEGVCGISLLGTAIFRAAAPRLGLSQPRIVQDVAVAIASTVWIMIRLRVHGVDLTSLIATSAVLTAVLGFSLQDTLGNILGGMAIQLDQSFQVGDWIKADDLVGKVVEIRWRYTAIETRNWETVIFPNSVLVKNKFLVLGRRSGEPRQWRRWVWFNVDFRFQPAHVIEAVEKAIRATRIANVSARPEPNCVAMDFTESTTRYALRYWLTDLAADDTTDSQVREHLFVALDRAGIPLSIPAQAVFVTRETEKRKARKSARDLARRAEAISRIELFRDLKPEEREQLARRLAPAPFARGDVIMRQGDQGDGLFVIAQGEAEVNVSDGLGHSRKVRTYAAGDFFGEMGLMTGSPRKTTVVAASDMMCYRLTKEAFQDIIQSRPDMAEGMSRVLADRVHELDEALHSFDEQSKGVEAPSRHDLLDKIRRFFGLEKNGEVPEWD